MSNDIRIEELLAQVRFKRPYGKVVEVVFTEGSLKAAAKKLGWSTAETWRQFRLGLPEFVKVVNQRLSVG